VQINNCKKNLMWVSQQYWNVR